MGLNKYRLGNLIEQVVRQNTKLEYGVEDVRGVSNTKGMIATKADMSSRSLAPFYIIEPGEFVFNRRTTRNGERLGMAFNDTDRAYIFTNDYVAFHVRESARDILSAEYLYMFFCRDEFDRYVRVNSWGSATEFFNWEDMCAVEIELPPIDVQQKYVAVYRAILANQQSYEEGLEKLKLAAEASIEQQEHSLAKVPLGRYIELSERYNDDGALKEEDVAGISIEKKFMETKADLTHVNLRRYRVILPNEFAFVPVTSRNGEKISMARNESERSLLCSSVYTAFRVRDERKLLPAFLSCLLERSQFDRYARFHSWGTAREIFDWDALCKLEIPVPDWKIQQAIANLYTVYRKRQQLAERLKSQLAHLCPILIRGAMDEAAQA